MDIEILHEKTGCRERIFAERAFIKKFEDKSLDKQKDLQEWDSFLVRWFSIHLKLVEFSQWS